MEVFSLIRSGISLLYVCGISVNEGDVLETIDELLIFTGIFYIENPIKF